METSLVKKLKRNILLDYCNVFITNLNMQSSIWVLYLAFKGMSLAQIGILEGIYHTTSMLFEIPSGAIADLLGRKKSMIASNICITVSCLIMLYAGNFWLFALSFFFQALGENFNSGSEEALVYDSMIAIGEEERYTAVSGKLNIIIEVSQGIATVAGGILAEYSFFWCYAASLIIALLAFIPVLFMTEAPFEKTLSQEGNIFQMLGNHFKTSFGILKGDIRIFRVVVFFSATFAAQTLLFFYGQQYFSDLGYNKIQISVFMLAFSLCGCLGAFLSDKVFTRFGSRTVIPAAFIIAVAICSFALENTLVAVIMFSVASFCNSLLYPIQSSMLNALIPSEQRATLISVDSMFFSIAMIIIFPITGAVADVTGLGKALLGVGVLLGTFAACWALFVYRKDK